MKMKALRGCGSIWFQDKVNDWDGVRIARDFLQGVIKQLCIQDVFYHAKVKRHHFLQFNERLMYSQMAVAINALTNIHVSEEGFARNKSGESTTGRADFWAKYRKMHILLELKQCYFSANKANKGIHAKHVSKTVSSVIDQTRSLKKTARGWEKKAVLIGLCVMLPYCERNSKDGLKKLMEEPKMKPHSLGMEFVDTIYEVNKSINFVGLWLPPDKMLKLDTSEPGKCKWEYNPFVGFAATILPL